MRIQHLDEAVADGRREAAFWKSQEGGLQNEFADELEKAIETIMKTSKGYVLVSKTRKLRRFYEKRFHTHILFRYVESEDLLQIARIYNARMNPKRFLD